VIMKKTCTACGELKPILEFYAQKGCKDGHQSRCKECAKKASRETRANNIEYYLAYDRARGSQKHRVEARLEYQKTKRGIEASSRAKRKYIERNPEKRKAHIELGNAIRDGRIKKKPCEVCGTKAVTAHHDDYNMPLCVRWLCTKHHAELHKTRRVEFEQQKLFA
jgi:ribosomal protein S27AE